MVFVSDSWTTSGTRCATGPTSAAVFASAQRGGCVDPLWRLAHDGLPSHGRHLQLSEGLVGRIIERGAGPLNPMAHTPPLGSSSVALLYACWEPCRTVCAGFQVVSCRLRASFTGCTLPTNLAEELRKPSCSRTWLRQNNHCEHHRPSHSG